MGVKSLGLTGNFYAGNQKHYILTSERYTMNITAMQYVAIILLAIGLLKIKRKKDKQ